MKNLFVALLAGITFSACAADPIVRSGWTTTGDAATARAALGITTTTNFAAWVTYPGNATFSVSNGVKRVFTNSATLSAPNGGFALSGGTLTVSNAGTYRITGTIALAPFDSGANYGLFYVQVLTNGTLATQQSGQVGIYSTGSGYGWMNADVDCIVTLAANDTVALGLQGYNNTFSVVPGGAALVVQTLTSGNAASGGGGGGAWGEITGTLSDQTDLQAALDAKVSTNGGTSYSQTLNSATLKAGGSTIMDTTSLYGGGQQSVDFVNRGLYTSLGNLVFSWSGTPTFFGLTRVGGLTNTWYDYVAGWQYVAGDSTNQNLHVRTNVTVAGTLTVGNPDTTAGTGEITAEGVYGATLVSTDFGTNGVFITGAGPSSTIRVNSLFGETRLTDRHLDLNGGTIIGMPYTNAPMTNIVAFWVGPFTNSAGVAFWLPGTTNAP